MVDVGVGRLLGGDGLRAVAMLALFAYHVSLFAYPGQGFGPYAAAGPVLGHLDLGLALFFALSGYLVVRPFARAYVLGSPRPSVRRYVRNRALRILPVFYVVIALVLLRFGLDGSHAAAPDGVESSALQIAGMFLFLQIYAGGPAIVPVGQAWSLDAEMAFYVLVPLVAVLACGAARRYGTPLSRTVFAVTLIAVAFAASVGIRSSGPVTISHLASPPAILYAFLPGIALAVVEPLAAGAARRRPRLARAFVWGAGALALGAAVAYVISDPADGTALHQALGRRAALAAVFGGGALAGLIAFQLATGRGPRLLMARATAWMGVRSYSFYLIHVAVLLEIQHLVGDRLGVGGTFAVMVVVALPVTIILAAVSHRYVERPFLERRRRVAPDLEPTRARLAPAGSLP